MTRTALAFTVSAALLLLLAVALLLVGLDLSMEELAKFRHGARTVEV